MSEFGSILVFKTKMMTILECPKKTRKNACNAVRAIIHGWMQQKESTQLCQCNTMVGTALTLKNQAAKEWNEGECSVKVPWLCAASTRVMARVRVTWKFRHKYIICEFNTCYIFSLYSMVRKTRHVHVDDGDKPSMSTKEVSWNVDSRETTNYIMCRYE
jgi:hypothetical protein